MDNLEDMLRACMIEFKGSWEDYIHLVEFSYNNSLELLICGRMCAGTLLHIPRHRGRTSNKYKKLKMVAIDLFRPYHFHFMPPFLAYCECTLDTVLDA